MKRGLLVFTTFILTVLEIILGLSCFYYSLIVEGSQFVFFALLSGAYFCTAYSRVFGRRAKRKKEAISRRNAPKPRLWYQDLGQVYEYEVKAGEVSVRCFSNYFFQPNGPFDLVDMLVKDGKIEVKSGDTIEIRVNLRKGAK